MVIQTLVDRIERNYCMRPDDRISDSFNSDNQFISLTDVSVWNLKDEKIFDTEFLIVNRYQIVGCARTIKKLDV